MSSTGSSAGRSRPESGRQRTIGKATVHYPVPTTESAEETGGPRVYAAPLSTSSMSTREEGPPRLYTSPSLHGHHPAGQRTVPPHQ